MTPSLIKTKRYVFTVWLDSPGFSIKVSKDPVGHCVYDQSHDGKSKEQHEARRHVTVPSSE